jgi:hypothetical protein
VSISISASAHAAGAADVTVAEGHPHGVTLGVTLGDWHEYALEDAARDDNADITTALAQQGADGYLPLGLENVLRIHPAQAELAPFRRVGGPIFSS